MHGHILLGTNHVHTTTVLTVRMRKGFDAVNSCWRRSVMVAATVASMPIILTALRDARNLRVAATRRSAASNHVRCVGTRRRPRVVERPAHTTMGQHMRGMKTGTRMIYQEQWPESLARTGLAVAKADM